MKNFLLTHRNFVLAITEDLLFLLFLTVLPMSALEILLPGSISEKIPLPFIFTLLALVSLFYFFAIQDQKNTANRFVVSQKILFIVSSLCILTVVLMTRDFGFIGSFIQLTLLVAILFVFIRKDSR